MNKMNPQIGLSFDGQCEAASQFCERCLNGKIFEVITDQFGITWDINYEKS